MEPVSPSNMHTCVHSVPSVGHDMVAQSGGGGSLERILQECAIQNERKEGVGDKLKVSILEAKCVVHMLIMRICCKCHVMLQVVVPV